MIANDKLSKSLDELFPRSECYVEVHDDGEIFIDGRMRLDQLQQLNAALVTYFEETQACPF